MRGADSGQAARRDLSALGHELGQQTHILVINRFDFLDAELADFFAPEKFASSFAWAPRASARTRSTRASAIAAAAFRAVAVT